jgi:hypothetical protein
MKRCAILFAILVLTLIIAVWVENRRDTISMDDVALEDIKSVQSAETSDPLSE